MAEKALSEIESRPFLAQVKEAFPDADMRMSRWRDAIEWEVQMPDAQQMTVRISNEALRSKNASRLLAEELSMAKSMVARVIPDPHTVEVALPPTILPPDELCGVDGCVYLPHEEGPHSWETGTVEIV